MILDFSIIDSGNFKSLLFVDESDYQERPGSPLLEVKFPSLSSPYKTLIKPKEFNIINTKQLCYSTDLLDFPDGLYQLRYSIDPNHLAYTCKNYMRLIKTKHRIKSLLLDKEIEKETIDKLYKLDIYTQAAEYFANIDKSKAIEYFELIQKELKKLECYGL